MVEQFIRQGEQWIFSEFNDLNASLPLTSIGYELKLREIYDKVAFISSALKNERLERNETGQIDPIYWDGCFFDGA